MNAVVCRPVAPGRVSVAPGTEPRLMLPGTERASWGLADELAAGCWSETRDLDIIPELETAGLRGRGGAAFPAHVKWRAVRDGIAPRTVVANGEEGEPSSSKDQWLLTRRPHLVLHGLALAARAVEAGRAVVYLSHPATVAPVRAAIAEAAQAGLWPADVRIDVHMVEPTYVAGEETSVVRSINGGPALPVAKPPRPFEVGVGGGATLVTNVETLAHASWIAGHGASAYRSVGTAESPGTTLFTVTAPDGAAQVVEAPVGIRLSDLATSVGVDPQSVVAIVMGGWFGGILGPGSLTASCCNEGIRAQGSSLGCAAVTFLGPKQDPLRTAADIARWFTTESAQQCGVCIKGTAAIARAIEDLPGATTPDHRDKLLADLERWGIGLVRRGACALLDGSAALARTTASLARSYQLETTVDDKSAPPPGERNSP